MPCVYLPRASLSERIARQAIRLALGTVFGSGALASFALIGAGVACLSYLR